MMQRKLRGAKAGIKKGDSLTPRNQERQTGGASPSDVLPLPPDVSKLFAEQIERGWFDRNAESGLLIKLITKR
jgi:hypothetical protein